MQVLEDIIKEVEKEKHKADNKCKYIAGKDGHTPEYEFYNGKSTAYEKAANMIRQAAIEYNNGWIPADDPPKDDSYVLLSFANFSIPLTGRYKEDKEGGAFYIGDQTVPCMAQDIMVDAWQPLPGKYRAKGE